MSNSVFLQIRLYVHSSLRNIPFVTTSVEEHFTIPIYWFLHHYNIMNNIIANNCLIKKNFNFKKREKKKYSPMYRIFYHLARFHFSSTDSEYIYSVSNNRVLVCIRGFIIAWLRSIEIPRSARYSKRRQKLSPIRARWSNLAKFQAKFQYRNVPIHLHNECQIYLKNLRGSIPLFPSRSFHVSFSRSG